jgi:predicted RNase H-like nuclease (RuvC/YqgF family)
MSDYSKLTKKELLYTLLARDVMIKDCRERFELHKNTDAKTIQDQSDLIEELKAKLAESEIRSKESEIFYKREINRRDTKLRNIKQQLAEKEKEVEELKNIHIYDKTIEMFSKGLAQKNQDKISFAVEQLEKVKDSVQAFDGIELIGFIDNQIEQLKEMPNEK